jgi:hypothetical protein
MKLRYSVSALTLTLALASQPVLAQSHRGGGSHGGGSRGGGSHGGGSYGGAPRGGGSHGGYGGSAVARSNSGGPRSGAVGGMHYGSRPGYAPRGSVAEQRHPRAGTGYGYRPGYGYYRGGHSYYRPYYGHRPYYGYRPYYPYYPYYSYWPGVSLSFGWGYGSTWPSYVGGYYGSPGYSVGVYAPDVAAGDDDSAAPPPPARDAGRSYEGRSGRVRLEVRPDDTSVYVDDEFRGTAREARIMNLSPGRHRIELVRPGFAIEQREVTVVSGESQDVLVELLRP